MPIHIVQSGDTLWSIARRYGVPPERIISDNNLENLPHLVVGQALLILQAEVVYTVRQGDTLSGIARQAGISLIHLLQNNPSLAGEETIFSGQQIVLRMQGQKRRELTVNAYAYPHIRQEVLLSALPFLTYLTIFGYGFTTEGELIPIDDKALIQRAYEYQVAPVMLLSSITEDGHFSGERASLLFHDTVLQNQVLDQILETMRRKGYVGLDVDFEYIAPEDREAYEDFLENVASRLHPEGFFVNTDLAPKTSATQAGLLYESHDYRAIGEISDTVLLMTYEWGYTYGPPMAVAPLNQVRRVIQYAMTEIPSQKVLMGIPNYGYDWPLPYERGMTEARTIGNPHAVELAARYGAQISFDETAQSPYFEYYRDGSPHIVWFEDVRSIQSKLRLADEFDLRGVGYWNAMRPFAQNWGYLGADYEIRKVMPEEAP